MTYWYTYIVVTMLYYGTYTMAHRGILWYTTSGWLFCDFTMGNIMTLFSHLCWHVHLVYNCHRQEPTRHIRVQVPLPLHLTFNLVHPYYTKIAIWEGGRIRLTCPLTFHLFFSKRHVGWIRCTESAEIKHIQDGLRGEQNMWDEDKVGRLW